VLSLLQGKISINELEELFEKQLDIKSINTLYKYMLENSLRYRNRAVTIFSYSNKLSKKSISEIVGMTAILLETILNSLNQVEPQNYSISAEKKQRNMKRLNTKIRFSKYCIRHHRILNLIGRHGGWRIFIRL